MFNKALKIRRTLSKVFSCGKKYCKVLQAVAGFQQLQQMYAQHIKIVFIVPQGT
jgi:hypothetical protein